ncbi:MAG: Rv1355c family protein [Bacteroidota bacterium]|nr:Rv1355c family protein [Bacteroidota bacterium]
MPLPFTSPGDHKEPDTYKPVFFRLSQPEERESLALLHGEGKIHFIYDRFENQVNELIRIRQPAGKADADNLKNLAGDYMAGRDPDSLGVWVFYPWADRLVHILDEEEFIEVRTNRNRNKITLEERNILSKQKIGIIGLSVGQAIALTMAIERTCGELRLTDFDTIDLSNLNRLRSGVHCLGVNKAVVAAREIAGIDPFLNVQVFTGGVTEGNIEEFYTNDGMLDIVVDECDSLEMKILCRQKARAHRIPVVMDTSDRGMLDVERFDLEPERPLFHGLVQENILQEISGLSQEQKIPYLLAIAGYEHLSARAKASLAEVGKSLLTWPQLASSVMLGGAATTDVCRRIALGEFKKSGRYYIDIENIIR